jgi:3-oxoacyl-[acyl-carrier protein] reductase
MNLGIDGRTALIMASSQGLGKACALALAAEGCQVVVNGRHAEKLGATRNEIEAASGSPMTAGVADVTTGSGRAQLLKACPEPDILVTNNAGRSTARAGSRRARRGCCPASRFRR